MPELIDPTEYTERHWALADKIGRLIEWLVVLAGLEYARIKTGSYLVFFLEAVLFFVIGVVLIAEMRARLQPAQFEKFARYRWQQRLVRFSLWAIGSAGSLAITLGLQNIAEQLAKAH